MKNKCCINGCGEKGRWTWRTGEAYCTRHKSVLVEYHGRSDHFPFAPLALHVGTAHEGGKVGKPRAWRVARARKEREGGCDSDA